MAPSYITLGPNGGMTMRHKRINIDAQTAQIQIDDQLFPGDGSKYESN